MPLFKMPPFYRDKTELGEHYRDGWRLAAGAFMPYAERAQRQRDTWRTALSNARQALVWAMNMEPSPCRCLDFSTPPHVCIGHKAIRELEQCEQALAAFTSAQAGDGAGEQNAEVSQP